MGFRINTNIAALNAQSNASMTNRNLDSSLEKLSSGLRINKAADDASGMAIADSLRMQSNSLGQAVNNANDAIGIVQIADKAMDEQIKILDTIKTKSVQAAQDGQSGDSRAALQKDINRLLEELDNIANTTSYNGQKLLGGSFTNREFQIGADSNTTINASIGSTSMDKIGLVRLESSATMTSSVALTGISINGITLETVAISTSAGTGVGALANVINRNSDALGVKATYSNLMTGVAITGGDVSNLTINGVSIGTISGVQSNDGDGRLVNAINAVKTQTGVEAAIDEQGRLELRSIDGRGISLAGTLSAGMGISAGESYGKLSLTRLDARDIITGGLSGFDTTVAANVNLRDVMGGFNANVASASGFFRNATEVSDADDMYAGVLTNKGAMITMDIAESSLKTLDSLRGDLGSVQNQLVATINNISVTQVNVKAAESNIRDVDFASESANFSKNQILAQSGSYAMSQANAIQQNVMRLLQ